MKRLFIFLCITLLGFGYGSAQDYAANNAPPLTKSEVQRYLKTEIAVKKAQIRIKAHREEYDWRKREDQKEAGRQADAIIKKNGWDKDEYKKIRLQVIQTVSAIDDYKKHKKKKANIQERRKDLNGNKGGDDPEKAEQLRQQKMNSMLKNIESSNLPEGMKEKVRKKIRQSKIEGNKEVAQEKARRKKEKENSKRSLNQQAQRNKKALNTAGNNADIQAVRPFYTKIKKMQKWYGKYFAHPVDPVPDPF